ncbi:MAG TPA: hypothetical protein VI248_23115 [Kineosporiaceae bacterium]
MNRSCSMVSRILWLDPSPTSPPPSASSADGPGQRWLVDPLGAEHGLWDRLCAVVGHVAQLAGAVMVPVLLGVLGVTALLWWRRRQVWRSARARASWIEVEPPARSEIADGQQLWRQLTGLLRPGALGAWSRLLVWEVQAETERVSAGLWVPGTVEAGDVAQAVAAAYRRARVQVRAPSDAPTAGNEGSGRVSAGYVVVPRTSMWQPLLAETSTGSGGRLAAQRRGAGGSSADPLDGLWVALSGTPHGYRLVLQVMARPLRRRTRGEARRVRLAAGDRDGRVARRSGPELVLSGVLTLLTQAVVGLLDVFVPGPPRTAASRPSGRSAGPVLDPIGAQERRVAAAKARAELAEVCVRVVAVGPDRVRCRQLAWSAANALRGVVTAQAMNTIRLPDATRRWSDRVTGNGAAIRLRGRRPGHVRGWFVATDVEIGAVARLPQQPAWFRFVVAGAPHLPAPLGVPRLAGSESDLDRDLDAGRGPDRDGGMPGEAA